jgi:hypothetical protein
MWFDNNLYLRLVKKKSRDTEKSRPALTCADLRRSRKFFFKSAQVSSFHCLPKNRQDKKNFFQVGASQLFSLPPENRQDKKIFQNKIEGGDKNFYIKFG